ncbi:MAG TPA: ATP-binding protein [Lysobacter sp.]|nr:ATP-binding protein [Lysobacter sp.]
MKTDAGPLRGEDRDSRLLAACSAGTGLLDPDLRWRALNAALAELLRIPAQALLGQPLLDAVHPDDAAALQAQLRALLGGAGGPLRVEARWRRGDGGEVCTEVGVGVLRDAHGEVEAFLLQLRDLSGERDARQALDAAQRNLQMITDTVSHNLRAPVRAIESFAARLDERCGAHLDDAGRDHLARIRAAAERMSELLASLNELVHAGRAELRPAPVDVSLLAEFAGMAMRDRYPERDAELDVEAGLTAYGDERLLRLLMMQLLDNAWRFARPGQPVRVSLRGARAGGRVHLQLHDEGSGFDMRYAHKLFEPFQRLHGPDQGGGHGLGLAIAHRVVERHGGRIWAESAPEAGTTLHVELPATPPQATDAHDSRNPAG